MWRIIDINGDEYHICVNSNNFSVLKDNKEKFMQISYISCVISRDNKHYVYNSVNNSVIQKYLKNEISIVFEMKHMYTLVICCCLILILHRV
jgi:hypothetical protein